MGRAYKIAIFWFQKGRESKILSGEKPPDPHSFPFADFSPPSISDLSAVPVISITILIFK